MDLSLDTYLAAELAALDKQSLRRKLRGPVADLVNFSSNDYLGLARHPRLAEAAGEAAARYGNGAGASRLVGGNLPIQTELEEILAVFKGTEAALTFSSGYAMALGVIPAMVGKGDVVILDKLCHACLIDGARLSGATLRVYPHNDLDYLEKLLSKVSGETRTLILTESVFSMDGDVALLKEMVELKEKYGAWLLVDEAHATGIYGRNRRGYIEESGVEGRIELQIGTLSKALGCSGGYLVGSRTLVDYLINRARSLIYSTAPSPAVTGGALGAVRLVMSAEGEHRQQQLWARVRQFAEATQISSPSPIFPVILGSAKRALEAAETLQQRGFFAPAIRYPTVAKGKARLRITLNANHQPAEIASLAAALMDFERTNSKESVEKKGEN